MTIAKNFENTFEGTEGVVEYTTNEKNFFKGFLNATGETFPENKISISIVLLNDICQTVNRFEDSIKNLQETLDQQKSEINNIKASTIFLKPVSLNPAQKMAIQKYNQRLEWLKSIEPHYKNKIIAYTEENDSWKIITDAGSESELFIKIQKLYDKDSQLLKKIVEFYDFGVFSGCFKY
jgi:hypothetical protein